jgi:TonB family protein
VYDIVHHEQLDGISAEIVRAVPESGREPLVFTDPDSRTSMIIVGGRPSRSPDFQYPTCERCPDASYTRDARAHRVQGRVVLLATITEKGRTDGVVVVSGLSDGLTDRAVEAVRSWHFKPAIGKDGKPFATRVPIEVTFRLQ